MQEDKLTAVISLSEIGGADDNNDGVIVRTTVEPSNLAYKELDKKIKRARAEYISTPKTLKEISYDYNIDEEKLKSFCSEGKWNIIKKDPNIKEYMLEIVDEVYGAIDVYEYGKKLALQCMGRTEHQNPKDLRNLIDIFKLCHDEISKMRVMHNGVEITNTISEAETI